MCLVIKSVHGQCGWPGRFSNSISIFDDLVVLIKLVREFEHCKNANFLFSAKMLIFYLAFLQCSKGYHGYHNFEKLFLVNNRREILDSLRLTSGLRKLRMGSYH